MIKAEHFVPQRLRKNKNLTQEQLAEMIDIDPRNLSRIEVGSSFVKAETLEKILNALDVTTEQLFPNDHIQTPDELMRDINKYLNIAKKSPRKLEKYTNLCALLFLTSNNQLNYCKISTIAYAL
ncbi:helix-turn-helix transcriptional regulator [bacterium]|nr:helix-turn-helix transcriptional regulator [bacterium]